MKFKNSMTNHIESCSIPSADFHQVRKVEGFERIKAEYPVYLADESKLASKSVDFLFFPKDEAELVAVLSEMSERKIPMTLAGARTGLVGGSVPTRGALVSLERFDQVESIYYDEERSEWHLISQASVSLKALGAMLSVKRFPSFERSDDPKIIEAYEGFKADPASYFYPPDPTETSATLGGTVVTNASGARTYRYGPTRTWVNYIRVFLANGEYLDIHRGKYFADGNGQFIIHLKSGDDIPLTIPDYEVPNTKYTAGFYTEPGLDLIDLFIGSEGVLGVVTRVGVRLLREESKLSMVQFVKTDQEAVALTIRLRNESRLRLDFLEFYSANALNLLRKIQREAPSSVGMPFLPEDEVAAVFFELSYDPNGSHEALQLIKNVISELGADPALSWIAYEPRELARFKVFRHLLPETVNAIIAERKRQIPELYKLGTDLAVPDEHLEALWELYQTTCDNLSLEWVAFGHIGNNHIHLNILPRNVEEQRAGLLAYETFARKTVGWRGSVSAEHGIGKIKQKFLKLMYSEEQLAQMKHVKNALDPGSLLNPGDIFPDEVAV
jgi:D-lactate dehydrogenase (cytochrome)